VRNSPIIPVMLDGEAKRLQTPLRIRIRPRALRVLAPVKTEEVKSIATGPQQPQATKSSVNVAVAGSSNRLAS